MSLFTPETPPIFGDGILYVDIIAVLNVEVLSIAQTASTSAQQWSSCKSAGALIS